MKTAAIVMALVAVVMGPLSAYEFVQHIEQHKPAAGFGAIVMFWLMYSIILAGIIAGKREQDF